MARPNKPRVICGLPEYQMFGPKGKKASQLEKITLLIDEYEIFRLMDDLNLTQEETAKQVGVARTTVQRIYMNARKKIADAIVNGKILIIEGEDFVICDDNCDECLAPLRKNRRNSHGGKE
ncbi:MAG: DUF134 domain-containing protein [Tenericutes bacterium]|jgi:predicted DNA-binding protein (UPF0251 family)|nr:DUF134 domain-containing protein [Mycoplasmatota bacterium]